MCHPLVIRHLRSRTNLRQRCRLNNRPSNRLQGHQSHQRQLLPQRRRPRTLRPWVLQPSRERPTTTPHPQPQIMHHHQNGRLVVSGEERVVDNSWLIIFFSLFSPLVCSVIPNCTCCARLKLHLRNLLVLLLSLSQSQCPLSPPCSYPSIVDCTLVAFSPSFLHFCRFPLPPHSAVSVLRIIRCLVLVIPGLRPRRCFPFIYPICTV